MKQFTGLLILILFINTVIHAQSADVLFGERHVGGNKLSIYFDRQGSIYPNYYISDTALRKCQSSLNEWYQQHPAELLRIAALYKCHFQNYSPANIKILNDSIAAATLAQINDKKNTCNSATFLIHGFRKSIHKLNNDYTSTEDFEILEKTISSFNKTATCFVEIYWDGLYDCCFSANIKRNEQLFQLFDTAQQNALLVGKRLRIILAGTQQNNINIVTHSLGAKVAAVALFDAYAESSSPTPNQHINICLIAPAIGGIEVFKNYYQRHTIVNYAATDNYRLAIVYNINDFVLKKKDNKFGLFGPGPYKHGNTSLGCNYDHAAIKLKEYLATHYPHSAITLFNLSSVGKFHHLRNYCAGDNLKEMVGWMEK